MTDSPDSVMINVFWDFSRPHSLPRACTIVRTDNLKKVSRIVEENLEADQHLREQHFLNKLNDTHESSLKRLSDTHKEKIALLDRQFLQQKQQLMRAREAAIWVRNLRLNLNEMIFKTDISFKGRLI